MKRDHGQMHYSEPVLDELAFNFFRLFARVEYSLKACGLLTRDDGDAQASWQRFAKSIHPLLDEAASEELNDAVRYLLERPPMKQIAKNKRLTWEHVVPTGQSETDLIFLYLRRVRNNLFHGGKFGHEWTDPDRSYKLLQAGLIILQESAHRNPKVRRKF